MKYIKLHEREIICGELRDPSERAILVSDEKADELIQAKRAKAHEPQEAPVADAPTKTSKRKTPRKRAKAKPAEKATAQLAPAPKASVDATPPAEAPADGA